MPAPIRASMRVASLHVHPLKGGAIVDRAECAVGALGPADDRRWMVVDAGHRFLTQRELPVLARLSAVPEEAGAASALALALDGRTHRAETDGGRAEVTVWGDAVSAATVRPEDDAVLSAWLGRPVRLVRHDAASHRPISPEWTLGTHAFADGYPILVVLAASLDALNERIAGVGGEPVPMARFRPNVVIEGAAPWEDDGWASIRVGEATLDLVKPCARCAVTTVEQDRGVRDGDEPLRSLRDFRMSADRSVPGVLFGWNAVARAPGTLRAGDPVEVLERREPWPLRARGQAAEAAF